MSEHLSPLFSWRSAITESGLPPMCRLVALALSLHMNERGGSCFPSQATLARETGLHEQTVKLHLRRLREDGWITVERHEGKVPRYTASVPDPELPLDTYPQADPGVQTTGVVSLPGYREHRGGGYANHRGGGAQTTPEDVTRTTKRTTTPPTPPQGGRPNPACVWCWGTGWNERDDGTVEPCGCQRAPNRKPRAP